MYREQIQILNVIEKNFGHCYIHNTGNVVISSLPLKESWYFTQDVQFEASQARLLLTQKQYCNCEGLVRNFGGVYIVSSDPSHCGEVMNLISECACAAKECRVLYFVLCYGAYLALIRVCPWENPLV